MSKQDVWVPVTLMPGVVIAVVENGKVYRGLPILMMHEGLPVVNLNGHTVAVKPRAYIHPMRLA